MFDDEITEVDELEHPAIEYSKLLLKKLISNIEPKPIALTSERFVLELRKDGLYDIKSRSNGQLLIVGVTEKDVLAHYV